MIHKAPKISIVGVGRVGSAVAFAALIKGLAGEFRLVDRNKDLAMGQACDLLHASALAHPVKIKSGDIPDTAGSDIVVITASVPRIDLQSRLDLVQGNYPLFKEMIPEIAAASPDAILVIVTNPLDVMTYLAWKLSGFPPSRVIGTGTLIDTARFQSLIADATGFNPQDIHAYILGEHGDSEFAALSLANVGGVAFDERLGPISELFEEARHGGFQVYRYKGYTNYAIALSTVAIIESIVHDTHKILPVSTLIDGYLGVEDICLSVPAVIGRKGVLNTVELKLNEREQDAFVRSADLMRQVVTSLET